MASTLSPGTHGNITALYAGDGNHNGSTSASYTQIVLPVGSLAIASSGSEQVTLSFTGMPGADYVLERSSNLVKWVQVVTNTAPASGPDFGRIQYTETPPHSPAYYRTWQP